MAVFRGICAKTEPITDRFERASRARVCTFAMAAILSIGLLESDAQAITLAPASSPLSVASSVKPMVMIDMSKDHSLFYKAYNDYTALNPASTIVQTTYTNTIEYYGYFDSAKCYTYDTTNAYFQPTGLASSHYCSGNNWSGNFMNWATMTRMDDVLKLLYGGNRSTDTSSTTILQRVPMTEDGHAFAKFYNGADLPQLTPFGLVKQTAVATSSSSVTMVPASTIAAMPPPAHSPSDPTPPPPIAIFTFRLTSVPIVYEPGDQMMIKPNGGSAGQYMVGYISTINTQPTYTELNIAVPAVGVPATVTSNATFSSWSLTTLDLLDGGITLCSLSSWSTNPPIIRVARGNYSLWSANERDQCRWSEQNNSLISVGSSNGNVPLVSGINASAENPSYVLRAINTSPAPSNTGEYDVFVKVCDNSTAALKDVTGAPIGNEKCKQYPNGNYKPIGLLQNYGDNNQMQFGLMTGSFLKNISGGVLRRGMSNFSSEVNVSTDGTFISGVPGIVYNLNQLRVVGYSYGDDPNFLAQVPPIYTGGTYIGSDNCNFQLLGLVHSGGNSLGGGYANEGNCQSWGNPIGEIYLESLRYFAGKQPTPAFQYSGASAGDDALINGLSNNVPWTDPLSSANYCASLNAIVLNPSISSYDNDQMSGITDLNSSQTANTWTNQVGDGEGITGRSWFIGNNGSGSNDGVCTAKTITSFGAATGICPEAASQYGSFLMAGTAYYAHTNKIRTDIAVPAKDTRSLKVDTYAVQLSSSTPKITVKVGANNVTIEPSYLLVLPTGTSAGTIVDFQIISQTATGGSFFVSFDDSLAGGDFDEDTTGVISYAISGNNISITTTGIATSSTSPQGIGYIINGTNHDGPHYHIGALGFTYNDPSPISVTPSTHVNGSGGCSNCQIDYPPTTAVFTATGISASVLQDPLYYAAKWGGFDTTKMTQPAATDPASNYFYITNPGTLETALGSALGAINSKASSTTIAANSTSLQSATAVYQAIYNTGDWSSQLLSYPIVSGSLSTTPSWDAGALLKTPNPATRVVITYDNVTTGKAGIPFRFASLPSTYQAALNKNASLVTDGEGSQRVDWLRGDHTNEGFATNNLRTRGTSTLGDIVNSNPLFIGVPGSGYGDTGYAAFVNSYGSRTKMIYVGANDGMLHGFSTTDGTEKLAYIPSTTIGNLSALTAQFYSHQYYVDGSPVAGDVTVNGTWRTLLVGGMNQGGKGVYALDVTDPGQFTEANAASLVQWEFTSNIDPDLGYTYGRPAIVKLANGKWAAIFGNGYNSTAGKAYLFIVFLDRIAGSKTWTLGTNYLKIPTDTSTGNGLSEVLPVDTIGAGVTNYVYAGDLNGNMWKFDLSNTDPTQWKLAYTAPLFTTPSQPITTSPDVIRSATSGYIVVFGTGLYLQSSDPSSKVVQSFYGIWDDPSSYVQATFAKLQPQTIDSELSASGNIVRITSNNTVDYATKRGWYMNLVSPGPVAKGERVVYNPTIYNGRVTFTTLIPSTSPCDSGGTGWLMELDARTGSRTSNPVLDVNGDGIVTAGDLVTNGTVTAAASGMQTQGIPAGYTRLSNDGSTNKVYTGGQNLTPIVESATGSSGRLSWREIMR